MVRFSHSDGAPEDSNRGNQPREKEDQAQQREERQTDGPAGPSPSRDPQDAKRDHAGEKEYGNESPGGLHGARFHSGILSVGTDPEERNSPALQSIVTAVAAAGGAKARWTTSLP